MPSEPKRPIEELLEASAKARRAEFGADPSMPNPMRARLHDEISRQRGREALVPRKRWLGFSSPQFSFATAAAAVLLTAAVMWLGRGKKAEPPAMQLASNSPIAAPVPAAATDVLKSLEVAKDVAEAPILENGQSSLAEESERSRRAEPTGGASAQFAMSANEGAAPLTQPTENRRASNANLLQNFSQTARGQNLRNDSKTEKTIAKVLDSFQFEQDGTSVRVVDADGSTYTGKFEPLAVSAAPALLKRSVAVDKAAVSKPLDNVTQPNEQFFRATGFNASLKKQVVFEANYIPLPAPEKQLADTRQKSDADAQMPARIVGQARVAGEAAVAIDAATVAP